MNSVGWIATYCTWIIFSAISGRASTSTEIERLAQDGAHNYQTKEGQHYEADFEKVFLPFFGRALRECQSEPDTKEPAMLVFVIAGDGHVKRLLNSDVPFGDCVTAKLRTLKTLPRPPRDDWVVAFGAANHHHEEIARKKTAKNAPPDKPVVLTNKFSLADYDKAIAPAVAKARATYPDAKKRFLAGLPLGHTFVVRTRLTDSRGKAEDCLIEVDSVTDDQISGKINRVDLLDNYKAGQQITFPEGKIDNWLILRPDGTEDGNYVGKFLDHYKTD